MHTGCMYQVLGQLYPVKVKLEFRIIGDRLEAKVTEGGYKESIYPIEQEDVNDAYFTSGWNYQTFTIDIINFALSSTNKIEGLNVGEYRDRSKR